MATKTPSRAKKSTATKGRGSYKQSSKKTAREPVSMRAKYIIAGCTAIVLLIGLWWFFGGGSTMSIQKSMESYLENRYGKDFNVGRPHLEGVGIAETGSWRADAHPTDDKGLIFEVGRDQVKEERFFDNYSSLVLKKEEQPRVEAYLKELFPAQEPDFTLSVGFPRDTNPNAKVVVPGIDDAIKQYGNEFRYTLGAHISVKTVKDEQTKAELKAKFRSLHDFIKNRGINNPTLSMSISATEENAGYGCSTSDVRGAVTFEKMLDNCLSYPAKKGVYESYGNNNN